MNSLRKKDLPSIWVSIRIYIFKVYSIYLGTYCTWRCNKYTLVTWRRWNSLFLNFIGDWNNVKYRHSNFTCSVSYTEEKDFSIWGEGGNDIMMRWIIFLKKVSTMDLNSWPSSNLNYSLAIDLTLVGDEMTN